MAANKRVQRKLDESLRKIEELETSLSDVQEALHRQEDLTKAQASELNEAQARMSEMHEELLDRSTKLLVCNALLQEIAEAVARSAGEVITEADLVPAVQPDGLTPLASRALSTLTNELNSLARLRFASHGQSYYNIGISRTDALLQEEIEVSGRLRAQLWRIKPSLLQRATRDLRDVTSSLDDEKDTPSTSRHTEEGNYARRSTQDLREATAAEEQQLNAKHLLRYYDYRRRNKSSSDVEDEEEDYAADEDAVNNAAGSPSAYGEACPPRGEMSLLDGSPFRPGLGRPFFKHERPVTVVLKRCECGLRRPSLGLFTEGQKIARWCSKCPNKPREAVDVRHKRCECGLSITPIYGLPGQQRKNAKWCAKCPMRPREAVNVASKRCECGQRIGPAFGIPGEGRKDARWCAKCPNKPDNAIDIRSKRCVCGRSQPSFGVPGQDRKGAKWCAKCPGRPESAIDVVHRRRDSQDDESEPEESPAATKKVRED